MQYIYTYTVFNVICQNLSFYYITTSISNAEYCMAVPIIASINLDSGHVTLQIFAENKQLIMITISAYFTTGLCRESLNNATCKIVELSPPNGLGGFLLHKSYSYDS